jgi:hypothetical protein
VKTPKQTWSRPSLGRVATILTFGESPEKGKSYREIGIREIGEIEDKCISAFEIPKSRGRSGAIGLVDDHGR